MFFCNMLGHLELFFYDKVIRCKDNKSIPIKATSALGPKMI